jgi:GTP-binding protein
LKHPTVTFSGSAALPGQFPRDGLPEVAFLGRSNVGKSSLLNALARTKGLAKVSSTPGRTRLVNFFRVAGAGSDLYLVDLPGYGYARVRAEERQGFERLVTSYLLERPALALCLFLVDARHEPMPADEVLEAFLAEHELPFAVALMKADKLKRGEVVRAQRSLEQGLARRARAVVPVSAVTRDGIDDLWSLIRAAAKGSGHEVKQNGH